jgi:hypothetical protein
MKPIKEILLLKDAAIHKVQFDIEWFYCLDDLVFYLKDDLSEVDTIYLPMIIDNQEEFGRCCTFEDLLRGRKQIL